MTWVKLCSIKNPADIAVAVKACPNAVGFLVGQKYSSSDFIPAKTARELAASLPLNITPVLVTHLSQANEIVTLIRETNIFTVQLHGDCPIDELIKLRSLINEPLTLIYAVHVTGSGLSANISQLNPYVDMILLDSCDSVLGKVGGTGLVHDWRISADIVLNSQLPIILAGGLTPENVSAAIQQVKPFGVDVNSGVKNKYGFRSHDLCNLFVERAKNRN